MNINQVYRVTTSATLEEEQQGRIFGRNAVAFYRIKGI